MILLTSAPIDYHALTESVRSPASGAVVLFLGTVRELTAGRRTVALDYEGYPQMAEAELAKLESQARSRWPIDRVAIVHRLGRLELGEISVAIAVSCPHRKQAFEAGQFLIDELKVSVPIWKQENWDDGTTEWVHPGNDGTPATEFDRLNKNDRIKKRLLTRWRAEACRIATRTVFQTAVIFRPQDHQVWHSRL